MQGYFTPANIAEWSLKTQALSKIDNAHFDVFNAREAALKKSERNQLSRLLQFLRLAFETLKVDTPEPGAVRKLYKKSYSALQAEYAKADAQIVKGITITSEMSKRHVLIATALLSVKDAAWDAIPPTKSAP
jgi:hypothetical protein